MYGFRISVGAKAKWSLVEDKLSFVREWGYRDVHITQWSLQKFKQDKLWIDCPNSFVAVEGVLFNRSDIEKNPTLPIHKWRGSFACVCVNKDSNVVSIYNDQIGSHMLFWCQTKDNILVS